MSTPEPTDDRAGSMPLHARVHDELRELIEGGVWRQGERLPTETELATRFGVNRLTLRHALADLARSGLVVARQGVGTFVADQPAPIAVELGATDWAQAQERGMRTIEATGRTFDELLLDVAVVDAGREPAAHLGRGEVLWIDSVLRVAGTPTIHNQYWGRSLLSPDEVRRRVQDAGFGHRLLRDVVGADMYYAWRSFDAVAASRRHATILDVPVGSPLLQRCGLNCDIAGRPLLYLQRDAPSGRMHIVMNSPPPGRS